VERGAERYDRAFSERLKYYRTLRCVRVEVVCYGGGGGSGE